MRELKDLLKFKSPLLGLLDIPIPSSCQGRDLSNAILHKDENAIYSVPLFFHNPAWCGIYTRDYAYARRPLGEND